MTANEFNTPILFLIFNRPEDSLAAFAQIKKIKPKYLFIAADGPRANVKNEDELCQKTRKNILAAIDWDCELKTLFREKNLGCGQAVSSALNWFFSQVEAGIIIEDDCVADVSFFYFCALLLDKYKDNEKVFTISGHNLLFQNFVAEDYFFSKLASVWGWATWKRVWQKYDFEMKELENFKNQKLIQNITADYAEQKYWLNFFDEIKSKNINNWDYQLVFACFINNGLTIVPNVNLVTNIGTSIANCTSQNISVAQLDINNLKHPEKIAANTAFDQAVAKSLISASHYKIKRFLKTIKLFSLIKYIYKKL
jgi:hypothetical protein